MVVKSSRQTTVDIQSFRHEKDFVTLLYCIKHPNDALDSTEYQPACNPQDSLPSAKVKGVAGKADARLP